MIWSFLGPKPVDSFCFHWGKKHLSVLVWAVKIPFVDFQMLGIIQCLQISRSTENVERRSGRAKDSGEPPFPWNHLGGDKSKQNKQTRTCRETLTRNATSLWWFALTFMRCPGDGVHDGKSRKHVRSLNLPEKKRGGKKIQKSNREPKLDTCKADTLKRRLSKAGNRAGNRGRSVAKRNKI